MAGFADEIRRQLHGETGRVLVLVGAGNNGADALYTGAELAAGATVESPDRAAIAASEVDVVVAVDIPSGIDPDDGSVPDPVVLAADVTVTFGGYKAGLLIAPGSIVAGRVRLVDIGIAGDLARLEPLLVVPDGSGG